MTRARKLFAVALAAAIAASSTFALARQAEPSPHETGAETTAQAEAELAGHAPEHEGHHGPAPMNWWDLSDKGRPAFIALLVNFGLLLALYYTVGKRPVVEGLKKRRVEIGKDIEDARRMLTEAKERAKKYQADLKNADADAATAKGALVAAGKGEVEQLLADADERAERMKRDAERLVEQEMKQLQQDLLIETIDRAIHEARAVLERAATPEDHARLADELLAELGRKPAASRATEASGAPSATGAS